MTRLRAPGKEYGAVQTMKLFNFSINPRDIRRRLGLNQQEFWTKIGVTQSGGSRYESGRDMPKPVRELLRRKIKDHWNVWRRVLVNLHRHATDDGVFEFER